MLHHRRIFFSKWQSCLDVPTDYLLGVDAKKAPTLEQVDAKELSI